jgi:hypothetical protein
MSITLTPEKSSFNFRVVFTFEAELQPPKRITVIKQRSVKKFNNALFLIFIILPDFKFTII